ncbi:cytochrome P450 [Gymnopilus junonius]|uniref:Cytochrome P450 n=1 Tax=Gymnopilus junonius TaxID=109634 RepID=A0A9P5NE91_GYMJU|nr:cytochrome P450 [Gymnopilus junonius]
MMGLDRGMPLLQYDDKWRLQRKLARTALSGDAVKKYHGVQSHVAALMCNSFLTDPAHFRDHTRLAAGRIIMSVAYGLPVSDAQHEVHSEILCIPLADHILVQYITHAEATLEMISQATMPGAFIADIFPIFRHVPSWVPFISCKKEAQEGRAMIEHLVETPFEHVIKDITAGRAPPSFTHDLLADSSDADNETEYKHAVLWSAGSLYGAGGETTYTTVLVFLICMARHPEIQKKAQEELDKVVGQERIPAPIDRGKLPYVEAVIKEVMRWKPALPLGIPRRVDKDDEYCGYHIPSNSIVIPNVWAVAMDVPSKYPASDFVPERFLEDHPPIDPASYSFGFGRRVCPGKLLAENSVFLLITSILYCCNVSLPVTVDERGQKRQTELSVKFTTGLVSYPMPFECSIEPRSAERSYVVKRAAMDVV